MSQAMTNQQGQTVQVIDEGDLNRALMKLLGALVTVGIGCVWWFATTVNNTARDIEGVRNDIIRVERTAERNANTILPLKSTMDSLLVELRATQRQLSQVRRP